MRLQALLPGAVLALAVIAHGQENGALRLVTKIPVPTMTGTWDHLAADASTKRLFVSAQDDNAVEVIDLAAQKPLRTLTAGFSTISISTRCMRGLVFQIFIVHFERSK